MGWREILMKEIRVPLPGLPAGWVPRGPRIPLLAWYAQRELLDIRSVMSQLAAIVSTNASLPHGLAVCAEDAPNRSVARVLRRLAERTESGATLGEAMLELRGYFRAHWIGAVLASERSGALAGALHAILDEINEDLENGHLNRNRVAYFASLVVAQLAIMTFIVMRVMPVFLEILAEFEGEQPVPVRIYTGLAQAAIWHQRSLMIVVPTAALIIALGPALFRASRTIQTLVSLAVLPLPFVGPLYRARILAPFASAMRVMCEGGVPLPEALDQAARGRITAPYGRALRKAAAFVELGGTLSEALARRRLLFGARFIEFIRLGESREDLAGAFAQAHDLYRRSVLRRRRALADALVPIGVAVCGSGVLLVSLSVFSIMIAIAESITTEL